MGKSSAPKAPDYKSQAIATSNAGKYNEVTPFGTVGWGLRPGADPNNPQPGDSIRTTSLSPEQQQLYDQGVANQLAAGNVAATQLSQLGPDVSGRQALQDALYRRSTQYYDQNFGDQEEALRSRLINSGLAEGSEAYDREMRNFGQLRAGAYSDAADRAVVNAEQQSQVGQNSAVARLAQILAMSRGQMPVSGNTSAGPDLLGAANAQYNADLGRVNANNAQQQQGFNNALQTGLAALALFSDRRLKSDIVPIGEGAAGLPAYEYTIFGRRERGYMADEVAENFPSAVRRHPSGYLMVDYVSLGGRP